MNDERGMFKEVRWSISFGIKVSGLVGHTGQGIVYRPGERTMKIQS